MNEKNNQDTTTEVNNTTESINNEVETTATHENIDENNTQRQTQKQSFVKIREEKAREAIFKELGVKDIDDAKAKLAKADDALQRVEKIEMQLKQQQENNLFNVKVDKLTKILENEKVFDADALVNYIDIDEVELDAAGNIIDSDTIINQLKKLKPNYFGKEFIKTDNFTKQNSDSKPDTDIYKKDYDAKNYQAVIAKYLQTQNKK